MPTRIRKTLDRTALVVLITSSSFPSTACGPGSEMADAAAAEVVSNASNVVASSSSFASTGPAAEGRPARKIALVVAISDYAELNDINSDRDIPLVKGALRTHGFAESDIRILDGNVTRNDIVAAFRSSLIDRAEVGDIAVFHYSGHGDQITDNNAEEMDGYDEALVPYDVPRTIPAGYTGEKHLRDDTLGDLLLELRMQVGPSGNVIVMIDACFSGSVTRATAPVRRARLEPIGPPASTAQPGAVQRGGGGLFGDMGRPRSGETVADADLAPYVIFSAARHNERAYEAKNHDGFYVGSLSLALSEALARAGPETSYREVFEDVKTGMSHRVTNHPQAEGDLDTRVFNGTAVAQLPYFEVEAYFPEQREVRIMSGELHGLIPPAIVELHRSGTRSPTPETLVSSGTVTRADPTRSLVQLQDEASVSEIESAWVFVTRQSFGDLAVRVAIGALPTDQANEITSILEDNPAVILDRSEPDVRIDSADGFVEAVALQTGSTVGSPVDPNRSGWALSILRALQDYGRSQYLKRLAKLRTPALEVTFDIVPVEAEVVEDRLTGTRSCRVNQFLSLTGHQTEGNDVEFRVGDYFILDMKNEGQESAWVSILDLMPDGRIGVLWPPRNRAEDNMLQPGRSHRVYTDREPICYRVTEPLGTEMLMLVATQEPIDFHRIASRPRDAGQKGANELVDLFQDVLTGVRADTPGTVPRGGVSAYSRTIVVTAN